MAEAQAGGSQPKGRAPDGAALRHTLATLGLQPAFAGPAATRALILAEIDRARALRARAAIPQQ